MSTHAPEEDDTDAILAELEAETEDTTSTLYQQRMAELQAESTATNTNHPNGTSTAGRTTKIIQETYHTLTSDDETLRFTTEHEKAVLHFRHVDFARCAIMDEHLDKIAAAYSTAATSSSDSGEEIAFAKVDVNAVPFVVEKLGVRVLPCVIGFAKGIVKGKIVGFEGVCWDGREKDGRVTVAIEEVLQGWGLLKRRLLRDEYESGSDDEEKRDRKSGASIGVRRGIKDAKKKNVAEDDDWD